jgi:hypothetical protein
LREALTVPFRGWDFSLTEAVEVDARGTMIALLGLLLRMVEVGTHASGSDPETLLRTVGRL